MKKLLWFSVALNIILAAAFTVMVIRLGGVRYLFFKMANTGVETTYISRRDNFANLPKDSTDVVMLGNSLTEQGEWRELLPGVDLKNRGIGGDMTALLHERLPTVLDLKPKKLFLSIGVNDLLYHDIDYILTNYEKLLNDISRLSPSTKVYVQSLLPVNNDVRVTGIKNPDILTVNQKLKELTQAKGLTFIDLHRRFVNDEGKLPEEFTFDGVHLKGEAYLLWRDQIKEYITPVNRQPTTVN